MRINRFVIEKQVSAFRKENGLSSCEPISLKSLLLKLNVLTVFKPLSDNFSGMCLKDNSEHRFMLINSNHSRGRQHFTIAHELYHLYVEKNPKPHKCNPGYVNSTIEREADLFAALLLMPSDGLCQFIPESELISKEVSIGTILKLEHYFSVSRSALLYRLLNIGLIEKKTHSDLWLIGVKNSAICYGYDTSLYESANEGLVIGDFGEKAHALFKANKISEGHYWELLHKINSNGKAENEDCARC